MRWLGRLSALVVIGFGLWLGALYMARFDIMGFFSHDRDAWKLEMLPQATIAVGYVAEEQRWLSFPLPSGVNRIRIVSNGNLRDLAVARAARAADPLRRWLYALEIEVVDSGGRTILKRVHHHRTNFTEIRESANRVITPAYYLNEKLTPANGVVLNLDLTGFPKGSSLRIRASGVDPDLVDVVVRSYVPELNSERQVALLWQRLNEKQKSLLAKGSVYNPDLLIEEERRNLIRNLWKALGPLGAQGVDFKARELYILRDSEGEPEDEPIPPAGIISGPGQLAVFPVPEQGAAIHFTGQLLQLPGADITASGKKIIQGRWYGNSSFARESFTLTWEGAGVPMDKKFSGGLVELEAPAPMALRAFVDGVKEGGAQGQKTEITPERLYQRLFLADKHDAITFAIAHESNQAAAIRLEARHILPVAGRSQVATLHYEFLSAEGRIIRVGDLPLNALPARYDQIIGEPVGTRVAEFTEAFFSIPADATTARFSSAQVVGQNSPPVLVGLFSRPDSLPRKIRAPEDQFAFAAKGEKIPAWFALRPLDYERLIASNRSRLIAVQSRPLDDKPEIQAGLFDWQDFRPQGAWLARQLLVPRDPEVPFREEALATTFEPLAANRSRRLDFPSYLGVRQVTPTLIWVSSDDAPFTATVSSDGRPYHQFQGSGRYGETRLPPLPAGPHEIRVDIAPSAGARQPELFINHVSPSRKAYSTPIAARIEAGRTLTFDIERTSHKEETVTARLFQPAGWKGRSLLRARIEGPRPPSLTPLPGWIFGERIFDIRPDNSYAAPVFDTQGLRSDAGRPAYIPFPIEAPLGRYRISFSIEQAPPGYLAVSRLTPGVAAQRRLLEEPEARHVVIE